RRLIEFPPGHRTVFLTTFAPVSVDCRVPPHRSLPHVLEAIAAAAKAAPRGRWIRGSNGFQDMWQTPVWGHTTVDGHRGKRGEAEVIVGVDEAREQGTAAQMDDPGLGTDACGDLGIGTYGHNAAFVDGDCLCSGVTGIHRQDVPA